MGALTLGGGGHFILGADAVLEGALKESEIALLPVATS